MIGSREMLLMIPGKHAFCSTCGELNSGLVETDESLKILEKIHGHALTVLDISGGESDVDRVTQMIDEGKTLKIGYLNPVKV